MEIPLQVDEGATVGSQEVFELAAPEVVDDLDLVRRLVTAGTEVN